MTCFVCYMPVNGGLHTDGEWVCSRCLAAFDHTEKVVLLVRLLKDPSRAKDPTPVGYKRKLK